MRAIADLPDAIFAGCVSTVSSSLCLERLCLFIVLIDVNVW